MTTTTTTTRTATKKSIAKNYRYIRFNTSSVVAKRYSTSYYNNATWHIERNAAGQYVAVSSGTRRGFYPQVGSLRMEYGAPSAIGLYNGRKIVPDSFVAELLKQAQTGRGQYAEHYNVRLEHE